MRKKTKMQKIGLAIFLICMSLLVGYRLTFAEKSIQEPQEKQEKQEIIPIATQICADRYDEIVTLLMSILLQTKAYLKLYIFVDDKNWKKMNDMRLLPEIDSLIYLDIDMIVFRPIEDLWSKFSEFNSFQVLAIAPDNPNNDNWYIKMAKHPYYGIHGLNTGVMLMNLTRLRQLNYTDIMLNIFDQWHTKIMWGDQDLHNIWLHYHPGYGIYLFNGGNTFEVDISYPNWTSKKSSNTNVSKLEKLYHLPCKWNYRDSHCEKGNACESAEEEGPYILHGNGQQLVQKDPEPGFYAVNSAFVEFSSGENAKEIVMKAMKRNLLEVARDNGKCTAELLRLFNDTFQGM